MVRNLVLDSVVWALNWSRFGHRVDHNQAMLGDVLTFNRDSGGHVSMYIGEDSSAYHCLGGNQSDKVCISRIAKYRMYSISRPIFKIAQPINVRKVRLDSNGALSKNEA